MRRAAAPGRDALVLGAGGAARAAVAALARRDCRWAWQPAGRRPRRSGGCAGRRCGGLAGSQLPSLIVNATPVGQAGDAGELPVDGHCSARSGRLRSRLPRRRRRAGLVGGRAGGARPVDGLEVLVGQGAIAFRLLTGVEPPLDVMRRAARDPAI